MRFNELITKAIPEILDIHDKDLRQKTIEVWELVYRDTQWKCSIEEIPFNDKIGWVSLIKHTRSVTQEAVRATNHIKEFYAPEIDIDKVRVISILHDCCKGVETQPNDNNKSIKSKIGCLYPHGSMSFYYAKAVGLPDDICHAILTHTGSCKMIPSTIEGIVVRYVDSLDADILYYMSGLSTLMERANNNSDK